MLHELPKRLVDQGLIVPAAGCVYLFAEPVDDVFVEANGDPNFARIRCDDRPSLSLRKIVLFTHSPLPPMVSLLSATRLARRDQANVRSTPRIDDHQQSFKRIEADRYPSLLILCVFVADRYRGAVIKHCNRVSEVNVVLAQVCRRFVDIPLEAHARMICTDVCPCKPVADTLQCGCQA